MLLDASGWVCLAFIILCGLFWVFLRAPAAAFVDDYRRQVVVDLETAQKNLAKAGQDLMSAKQYAKARMEQQDLMLKNFLIETEEQEKKYKDLLVYLEEIKKKILLTRQDYVYKQQSLLIQQEIFKETLQVMPSFLPEHTMDIDFFKKTLHQCYKP